MRSDNKTVYALILLIIPILIIFTIYIISKSNNEEIIEANIATVSKIERYENPFDKVNIKARAAIVKDINTGEVIYGKNVYMPLPLASITKIMTAITALRESDPERNILITLDSLLTEGEDSLILGESFKLKDLIDFMLISSSNDSSTAIATNIAGSRDLFVSKMNTLAKAIGMNNTTFENESGLDIEGKASAYGSASDVAVMFEYVLENYPEIFEGSKDVSATKWSNNGFIHNVYNTNYVIDELNNLLATKTGFTEIAGGNLAVIVDPGLNRPVVIVVLGSSHEGRFNDVIELANSLPDYFDYIDNK